MRSGPRDDYCMHGKLQGIDCKKCANSWPNRLIDVFIGVILAAIIVWILHAFEVKPF